MHCLITCIFCCLILLLFQFGDFVRLLLVWPWLSDRIRQCRMPDAISDSYSQLLPLFCVNHLHFLFRNISKIRKKILFFFNLKNKTTNYIKRPFSLNSSSSFSSSFSFFSISCLRNLATFRSISSSS